LCECVHQTQAKILEYTRGSGDPDHKGLEAAVEDVEGVHHVISHVHDHGELLEEIICFEYQRK